LLALLVLSPLPLLLIVAAIKDATTMTIPNWISLAIAGAFLVTAPFALEVGAIGANALTAAGVLAAGFAMFSLNWIGGGDAKLLAAAALWMGLPGLPDFLIWTGIFGGGLSLGLLGARQIVVYLPIAPVQGALGRLLEPKGDIPYGLAIAAGGLAAFPQSAIFSAIVGA
jgi:prepilin peptidase CpaA